MNTLWMADNVERAAEVLQKHYFYDADHCHCGWNDWEMNHSDHVAQALADAGVIPRDDAEVTVEYGVRFDDGEIGTYSTERRAREDFATFQGGSHHGFASEAVVQRTVTTYRSEWAKVDDA